MVHSAAKPPIDDILQKVLDAVPFQLTVDGGVEEARRRLRELPRRQLHGDLRVQDTQIDGPAGPVPVRVYWPAADAGPGPHPVTMYFHGGGFALGDLDTHDVTCREHAVGAQTVVVSVDYRLAPEHPYPAAVEDVWAATCWVAGNAGVFGADASRLAVAGDSAGGTLAGTPTAAVTFNFDSYLQADGANAKFWIYDAATYPGAGATLLQNAAGVDMTGTISGPTASFSFAWSADKAWVGVAVGKSNAKVAVASGTILQSTVNSGSFVAGQERWYSNP